MRNPNVGYSAMKRHLMVNGTPHETEASPDTPLLWVLRENLGLTGTKFGCGAGLCGACTVHIDGEAVRSCSVPIESVADARITTIEGLSNDRSHPVQLAWIAQQVPQCGYCQSGMIMAVSALLAVTPKPTRQEVRDAITNICRCGTYPRIERAILEVASQ